MKQYLILLKKILSEGNYKKDRTGTGTISIFGYQMKINIMNSFPLLTTKYCNFKSIVYELLWFLQGNTNISYLTKNKVSIWNNWADKKGDLGPIYGKQWRCWQSNDGSKIDQIKEIINQLKYDKYSRRIILSSWNVGDLKNMSLPPCHIIAQFYVINNKVSCQLYQRSCDVFLGLPFNIASYTLLTCMLAQQCSLELGEFIWTGGDIHLYLNHLKQANLQLKRIPKKLPKLILVNKPTSIFNYKFKNFKILGYNHYPLIKASISV